MRRRRSACSVATHDVIIKGAGLTALLADLAVQKVTVIEEPLRPDRFHGSVARFIREVIVQRVEAC